MALTYYIRIDGVAGDSDDAGREGWFELGAFSFQEANEGSVTEPGKVSFSDLSLILQDNTALAALLASGAGGTFLSAVEIEGVETGSGGAETIFDLTLNDVSVGSVSSGAGSEPSNSVSLAYGKIGLVTTSPNGASQSFGWDVDLNAAIDPATLIAPTSPSVAPVPDPVVYYVRIDGVAGDATAPGYEGWFNLSALNFGEFVPGQSGGGGGGTAKAAFSDLSLVLQSETAIAALLARGAEGKAIAALEIEGVSKGSQVVYDLTLNDVLVSSVNQGASGDSTTVVSFNYGRIGLVTTSVEGGVAVAEQEFGWDIVNNVAIDPSTLVAPGSATVAASPNPVVYFLKIDGVAGDATAKGHEGWIELPSFFLGEFNPSVVGGSSGKVDFSDLQLSLTDNVALTALLASGASGKVISALEIEGVTGGATPQTVYELKLNDIVVSAVNQGAVGGLDPDTFVSFDYGKIGLVTTSLNPDGSVAATQSFGWNVATNSAIDPATLAAPSNSTGVPVPDPVVYYLKIDGVGGDATAKGYEGWFELPSFSFGESNFGALGGGLRFQDLNLSLDNNTALTALLARVSDGKFIEAVEIEGVSGAGAVVYDLTLNDVLVTLAANSGTGGDDSSSAAFAYGKIGVVTTGVDSKGSSIQQSFGWDVVNNISIAASTLVTPTSTAADAVPEAVTYYLKIDGIAGDSTSAGYKGWFEVAAFSLNGTNSGDVAGGGGNVNFQDLSLILESETALTALFAANASGKNFTALEIEGVASTGEVVYDLTLNNLLVSSVGEGASSGGGANAAVSFNFSQIGLVTTGGNGERQEFGWDLALGKAIDPDTLTAPTNAFVNPVPDPVTYYLKIDGVAGDSTSEAFKGWFDLASLSFGQSFSGLAGGAGGKVNFQDLSLNFASDAALATLLANSAGGTLIEALEIKGLSKNAEVIYNLTLNDVLVSSVSVGGFTGDGGPGANASFAFGKIGFTTTSIAGGVAVAEQEFGWDVVANVAIDPDTLVSPIDTTAPLAAVASQVLANDTGASATDLITTDGRVTLTGTASDDESLASVRIFDGDVDLGAATLNGGDWTFSVTLGLGAHALRAVATDLAGNATSTAAQAQITVVARDAIIGQPGQDTVNGTPDDDLIIFGTTNRLVNARGGDDVIALAAGSTASAHELRGGAGLDTLDLSALTSAANVNLATRRATGDEIGSAVLKSIENAIGGGAGDTITAGNQVNVLTGGDGPDAFVYASLNAARNGTAFSPSAYDTIADFHAASEVGALHDLIDLQGIDAVQGGRDNAFVFDATPWDGQGAQFTAAGQLRYQLATDGAGREITIVAGNVHSAAQGNGLGADFQIVLLGHHLLSASDFFL